MPASGLAAIELANSFRIGSRLAAGHHANV
jgi:hypothetical protein